MPAIRIGPWLKPEAPIKNLGQIAAVLFAVGNLYGCVERQAVKGESELNFIPAKFDNLPGWSEDNHAEALLAFWRSCQALLRKPATGWLGKRRFGSVRDWQDSCKRLDTKNFQDRNHARRFFETSFRPYLVTRTPSGESKGLFTGYYEPELAGALSRHGKYQTPIYGPPANLKRNSDRYFSRAEIEKGIKKIHANPIAWIADPIDAFFLHIQGSGRIRTENGTVIRVGFAGHNGHPYTAIGKVLIDRGAVARENISMQSIRSWLSKNPEQSKEVMRLNARYVFFRRLTGAGPIGAQGVALTPGRSIAIDPKFLVYGLPVWLDTTDPLLARKPFRRLLIAQDTGGAIKGGIRGDVFFGPGKLAANRAGKMKQPGSYYILIPRTADLSS